jgi:hypothetical protein
MKKWRMLRYLKAFAPYLAQGDRDASAGVQDKGLRNEDAIFYIPVRSNKHWQKH